jgi:Ca2+-transporting ATPase
MPKAKTPKGLTSAEAVALLSIHGFNELAQKKENVALAVLARQFKSVIVWILVAAAAISYSLGETVNFWVTSFIILFVIAMGFLQEFKAEKSMEALKRIVQPMATVFRDGMLRNLAARLVVPGDLLSLETGDSIPADATLLDCVALKTDESMLTGESAPVKKEVGETVFAGTRIVYGRCTAHVVLTGMKTELGKIATLIQQGEESTPLQIKMDRLGKILALIALGASALIFTVGVFRGASMPSMLMVALALAVAAVPEGLPLTLTLSLSYGMRKMAQKNAIVRRMMAVETLGSATVVCTDKTGTLTKNEMTVQRFFIPGQTVLVTGVGYKPEGVFKIGAKSQKKVSFASNLLKSAVLCNNSNLEELENGQFLPVGDPTEVALLALAGKAGIRKATLDRQHPRAEELLFTSERKLMTTIHKREEGFWVAMKGAPEEVLNRCTHFEKDGESHKMTPEMADEILAANRQFASKALRVLALAMRTVKSDAIPSKNVEEGLTFLGLVGMSDPPRPEVKGALQTCAKAGIEVKMITGDNEHTALAIAKQIGLVDGGTKAVALGKSLDGLSDHELEKLVKVTRVFARTHSEHKLRIVEALQRMGHIVAMTGDGVNDAPALKKANIGIAMGIKGTDVTKEASEMILQDDHFATIVEAVKEGRLIYQNIEKFTSYLISRNFTEIILIFLGVIFFSFDLLPLLALQILFINMIAEEMPSIGLGMDNAYGNIMVRKPRDPDQPILGRGNAFLVFSMAILMALISFVVFLASGPEQHIEYARTMAFSTIVAMVLIDTYNFRSLRESIFTIGFRDNRFLMLSVVVISCVMGVVMYHPFPQSVFKLVPLSAQDWMMCIGAASLSMVYMEIAKYFRRKLDF